MRDHAETDTDAVPVDRAETAGDVDGDDAGQRASVVEESTGESDDLDRLLKERNLELKPQKTTYPVKGVLLIGIIIFIALFVYVVYYALYMSSLFH